MKRYEAVGDRTQKTFQWSNRLVWERAPSCVSRHPLHSRASAVRAFGAAPFPPPNPWRVLVFQLANYEITQLPNSNHSADGPAQKFSLAIEPRAPRPLAFFWRKGGWRRSRIRLGCRMKQAACLPSKQAAHFRRALIGVVVPTHSEYGTTCIRSAVKL